MREGLHELLIPLEVPVTTRLMKDWTHIFVVLYGGYMWGRGVFRSSTDAEFKSGVVRHLG